MKQPLDTPVALSVWDIAFPSRTFVGHGVAGQASDELARFGARRLCVVTSSSVRRSRAYAEWRAHADGIVTEFSEVAPHTPHDVILEAARKFRAAQCDAIVSFGGGSAIDTGKGVALAVAGNATDVEGLARMWHPPAGNGDIVTVGDPERAIPPHAAIPTTLSGAAHSHSIGTSTLAGQKQLFIHPGVGPRVVLLDPLVTLETPPGLWASTGMKAFEHCVEALYSKHLPRFAEPIRLRGLELLSDNLVLSTRVAGPAVTEYRANALAGAGMSLFGWPSGPLGVSHALGHQAGAAWHVPHGASSAIFLPPALRFNGASARAAMKVMASALGRTSGDPVDAVIERVDELSTDLDLPKRLRDVGVSEPVDWDTFSQQVLADPIMAGNPRVVDAPDVVRLGKSAY